MIKRRTSDRNQLNMLDMSKPQSPSSLFNIAPGCQILHKPKQKVRQLKKVENSWASFPSPTPTVETEANSAYQLPLTANEVIDEG